MEKNNEKDLVKKPDLAIYIGNNETDIETEQIVLNEKRKHIKILACAGSGKTYLMVSKVIELIKNNKNNLNSIAVMTFTELAAKDLKKEIYCRTVENKIFKSKNETFQKLQKIFIGTIHSFCLNVIKQIKSEAINFNEMKVLNESQVKLLIYRFYKELNFNKVLPFTRKINKGFDVNSITIPDYLKLVYKACEEDIYLPKYNTSSKMPESIKNLYEKFNAFLLKRKNLTFSLILKNFIDSFKKFKEQMKELIKDIKYMIIDEYQDVNAIQEKITQIFIENNTFLYIVGDDDQAIYQFRGGNEKYLNDFEENIKLLKVKNGVLSLKKINTRRCSTGIVYLADKIVGNMILGKRCEKVFKTISKYSFEENDLTKRIYETKEEEIKSIIDLIKKYHELGVEYEHIAVITRRNVNIDDFCYAFLQNNIPYKRNENGGIFCYDKFEKEEYLAFIFLLLNKPESIKKNDNSFSVNYLKNKNKIIGNKYMTSEMFDFIENEYCKFENAEIDVEKIIL
jgi:DNA helicase-2/ATP-dependent DNA helicase PcrA